jgi:fructosamine-3-kinase
LILPENIRAACIEYLGGEPTRVERVGGGMVNQAVRVETKGTRYFVKWHESAPPGLFETEARGLALLHSANAFRIPQVIAYAEAAANAPAYLILEWLESASKVNVRVYAARFGQALAALHRVTAATFGLDHDNYIGEMPQANLPTSSWAAFYRDQRIIPQMQIAQKRGYLPLYREARLWDLVERIEEFLAGSDELPALIHGDLWDGNFFAATGDQPVLFDPAVFYGHREMEIAFAQMFNGMPFYLDAYNEAYRMDAGYHERRALLQLYHMLVHLNHFGERYGSGVDDICNYYLD